MNWNKLWRFFRGVRDIAWDELQALAFGLVVEAERRFREGTLGSEKFNWVWREARGRLRELRNHASDELLTLAIELAVERLKKKAAGGV